MATVITKKFPSAKPSHGLGVMLNPLSTRYYDPARMSFIFEQGNDLSIEGLLRQFISGNYRGQIVGPCGTGKSTLLTMAGTELRERGYRTKRIVLRQADRILPKSWADEMGGVESVNMKHVSESPSKYVRPELIMLLDGAEQLSLWSWLRFRVVCRRRGWGVLLTSHHSIGAGFSLLWNSAVSVETGRVIVKKVLAQNPDVPRHVTEDDVAGALRSSNGNMRLALFELYDLYEERAAFAGS